MAQINESGGYGTAPSSEGRYMDYDEAGRATIEAAWNEAGAPGNSAYEWFDGMSADARSAIIAPPSSGSSGGGGGGGGSTTTTDKGSGSAAEDRYVDFKTAQAESENFKPIEKDPPPASSGGGGGNGGTPTYNDDGMATNTGGSGGSGGGGGSSRRSSGGGGGSAGTSAPAAPAAPAFPGGGFGTPNAYPTLPMTPIRAKILGNLSGVFPNAGRFPTPPGGWREDMAPMFTSGAFGGVSAPAQAPAQASAPSSFQMPSMPSMGGGIPGGPAPSAPPPLPDPNAAPPEAMFGLVPPQMQQGGMPPMAPSFSQPGFVAPGSPMDMQMQRRMGSGNAAPLPASLRQRFGL